MKTPIYAIAFLLLSGCATAQPSPDFNSLYADYSCTQLKAEHTRIGAKIDEREAAANSPAQYAVNAAAVAVAISKRRVLHSKPDTELQNLKQQQDTLERLTVKKGCI